jgi:hypothetical protein
MVSLPFSIGIFPQITQIEASQLEEEFQKGRMPHDKLYFNKGL